MWIGSCVPKNNGFGIFNIFLIGTCNKSTLYTRWAPPKYKWSYDPI